jgi:hypothetical protein
MSEYSSSVDPPAVGTIRSIYESFEIDKTKMEPILLYRGVYYIGVSTISNPLLFRGGSAAIETLSPMMSPMALCSRIFAFSHH